MQEKRIPLAASVRWRRDSLAGDSGCGVLLAVVASGWLWQRTRRNGAGIGEVDSPRVDITSPTAGQIVAIPPKRAGRGRCTITCRPATLLPASRISSRARQESRRDARRRSAARWWRSLLARPDSDCRAARSPRSPPTMAGTSSATSRKRARWRRAGNAGDGASPHRGRAAGDKRGRTSRPADRARFRVIKRIDSTMPQWGTPVRIKMPNDVVLRPGTLVDVAFRRIAK